MICACAPGRRVETRSRFDIELDELRTSAAASGAMRFRESLTDSDPVDDDEFPGVGAFVFTGADGTLQIQCSGIELASGRVLTAAHCFSRVECFSQTATSYDATKFRFVTGPKARAPETTTDVLSWIIEDDFSPSDCTADLAIAILDKGAPHPSGLLSSANIAPPTRDEDIVKVGYGWSAEHDDTTGALRAAGRREKASMVITKLSASRPSQYFEYVPAANRSSQICAGDSGGPSFHDEVTGQRQLVGITSNGAGSARCKIEPRDTDLATYRDWVASHEH